MDEELPVIRAAHEFVVWLIPKIGKFPRDLRFTVGEKIERQSLAVLEGLIRARYARQRTPMLDAVNVDRFFQRLKPWSVGVVAVRYSWCLVTKTHARVDRVGR
jgi:hypothetical protein